MSNTDDSNKTINKSHVLTISSEALLLIAACNGISPSAFIWDNEDGNRFINNSKTCMVLEAAVILEQHKS